MSQGPGLVRTTCSSGSAPGAGAGAGGAQSERLDLAYPRTHSALLKVAQMVTLLIAFICVKSSWRTDYSAYSYFEVVTICDLIMILAFYLVHFFRLDRMLTCINWPLSEFLHYIIGTLLLFIASIVAASKSYGLGGLVAGSIFGFIATFLCMLSLWLYYKVSCVQQSTGLEPLRGPHPMATVNSAAINDGERKGRRRCLRTLGSPATSAPVPVTADLNRHQLLFAQNEHERAGGRPHLQGGSRTPDSAALLWKWFFKELRPGLRGLAVSA
ncbi:CKLF-like MARVEL transmembrane domain-containing protein 7 [Rhynchocyon petersi]